MLPEDDVRETPPELFAARAAKWGPFTLDAAATHANAKAAHYYTETGRFHSPAAKAECPFAAVGPENGLTGDWFGRVWINPPFTQMALWAAKCWRECAAGRVELIDFLSPGTRCEQAWWQKLIEPYRDEKGELVKGYRLDTDFIAKRPRFLKDGVPMGSPKFGVVMLTWRKVG
jgi:hypothetical protein